MARAEQTLFRAELLGSWDALEPHWLRLASEASPFQSATILGGWYRAFAHHPGIEPLCLRIIESESGQDAVFLPLVRQRRLGLRHVEFAGGWALDINAPALGPTSPSSPIGCKALFDCLKLAIGPADILNLTRMPERIYNRPNPLVLAGNCAGSEYSRNICDLTGGWDGVLARLDPSLRKKLERRGRQLKKEGKAVYRLAETPQERTTAFKSLEEFQRRRLGEAGIAHIFDNPSYRSFYKQLAVAGGERVMVPVIELNGAIVAVAMVLCGVGTASLVRHGYVHGDLERLGLGNLIIAHCVRTAAARGLGDFDHSIGNAGWKAGYRPRQDPLFDLSALLTLPGTVFGAVLRLKRRFGASSLSPIEAWPF